jgi:hypothetical protein
LAPELRQSVIAGVIVRLEHPDSAPFSISVARLEELATGQPVMGRVCPGYTEAVEVGPSHPLLGIASAGNIGNGSYM